MDFAETPVSRDSQSRLDKAFIVIVVMSLTIVLPLYTAFQSGLVAVFNHLAADAFYYFSVAKRSVLGFYTYDGQLPINGFHPLWQYVLTFIFDIVGKTNDSGQLYVVFCLCILATALGYTFAALGIYQVTRSKMLSVLIIPGLYNIVLACFGFQYLDNHVLIAPWAFINGMESCLSVFFGGYLLYRISKYRPEQSGSSQSRSSARTYFSSSTAILLGTICMLMIMARLDDVFLAVSFSLCFLCASGRDYKLGMRHAAPFLGPLGLALLLYLPFNYYFSQSLVPLSGVIKSGLSIVTNIKLSILAFFPMSVSLAEAFGRNAADVYKDRLDLSMVQALQVIVPAVLALLFSSVILSKRQERLLPAAQRLLCLGLLGYVLLKAGYNFVNCSFYAQGTWY